LRRSNAFVASDAECTVDAKNRRCEADCACRAADAEVSELS